MIKSILALIAVGGLSYKAYLHYLDYQRIKNENDCLREQWRKYMAKK